MENLGTCKKCLGVNIEYSEPVFENENVYFPYVCDDCNYNGKEVYKMTYIKTE